uniref:Uncharacterized protein n=1 Tax=Solanum lycopersicum TaxID=4081 RepID=A0A3Q7GZM0_SOLLC
MCYPRERPGRFVPPDEGQRREQVEIQVVSREVSNGNGSSAEAGTMKQCVCSPTHHPGSFRCRHHHADYKWAAQQGTIKTADH